MDPTVLIVEDVEIVVVVEVSNSVDDVLNMLVVVVVTLEVAKVVVVDSDVVVLVPCTYPRKEEQN